MNERESTKARRYRRRTRNLVHKHSPYKPKRHVIVKKYNRRSAVVDLEEEAYN